MASSRTILAEESLLLCLRLRWLYFLLGANDVPQGCCECWQESCSGKESTNRKSPVMHGSAVATVTVEVAQFIDPSIRKYGKYIWTVPDSYLRLTMTQIG